MDSVLKGVRKNPETLEEAKQQELALLGRYLELEQQRDNLREEQKGLQTEMGNLKYMVYATREMIKLFEKDANLREDSEHRRKAYS